MPNIVHDIKIKSLIRKYQSISNENKRDTIVNEIIELLAEFIYNFPRLKYQKNNDLCSDFFIYTYEYIPKIVEKFDLDGKASFQTWFAVVMFNLWRNFRKSKSYKEKYNQEILTSGINYNEVLNRELILEDSIIDECCKDENGANKDLYVNSTNISNINKIFKKMPKKVRVTLRAHFFEFFKSSDIEEAVDAFQLDFMLTLRKYEVLVTKTRKQYKIINDLIDDIHKLDYDIKNLHIQTNNSNNERINNNEYSNKLDRLKILKNKKIEKLKNTYIKLTPKEIAGFFNTNANSISNLLHRGKNYVKEYINNLSKKDKLL